MKRFRFLLATTTAIIAAAVLAPIGLSWGNEVFSFDTCGLELSLPSEGGGAWWIHAADEHGNVLLDTTIPGNVSYDHLGIGVPTLDAGLHTITMSVANAANHQDGLATFTHQEINCAGTTGPQGPAGPAGATGPAGTPGAKGADGKPGTNGANGVDGKPGATGATGPQGPAGATGPAGPAGANGNGSSGGTGPKGDTGTAGSTGPAGPAGPAGKNGTNGKPGPAGHNGKNGKPGKNGHTVVIVKHKTTVINHHTTKVIQVTPHPAKMTK